MKKNNRMPSLVDLSVSPDQQKYDEIARYADINIQNLIFDWLQMNYEDLRTSLLYDRSDVELFLALSENDSKSQSLVKVGSLLGTIGCLEKLLIDLSESKRLSENDNLRIKHLPEVISALETHGSMTHTELCNYLQLKPSTLSEAMHKIQDTGFINVISSGKYKLYNLSDPGIRYGRFLRKKHSNQHKDIAKTIDELLKIPADAATDDRLKQIFETWLRKKGSLTLSRKDSVDYYQLNSGKVSKEGNFIIDNWFESTNSDGVSKKILLGTDSNKSDLSHTYSSISGNKVAAAVNW